MYVCHDDICMVCGGRNRLKDPPNVVRPQHFAWELEYSCFFFFPCSCEMSRVVLSSWRLALTIRKDVARPEVRWTLIPNNHQKEKKRKEKKRKEKKRKEKEDIWTKPKCMFQSKPTLTAGLHLQEESWQSGKVFSWVQTSLYYETEICSNVGLFCPDWPKEQTLRL